MKSCLAAQPYLYSILGIPDNRSTNIDKLVKVDRIISVLIEYYTMIIALRSKETLYYYKVLCFTE
jgi:hypothetical protein